MDPYKGKIRPRFIGRKRDFWHRLSVAYCDLQIRQLQQASLSQWPEWQTWADLICSDFSTVLSDRVSQNKCRFPGFSESIEKVQSTGGQASGLIAGLAKSAEGKQFGLVISNSRFQAGAIDMVAGLRMMAVIESCRQQNLPWVAIISSGGMQTKEGAGALFSMPVINEAISQYYLETGRRALMVGFGDCTGGAQASFVTHPDVDTWYISGANIPFAGQVVIPSYLPSNVCLANYLVDEKAGQKPEQANKSKTRAMKGLVSHPFDQDFDQKLREIDPKLVTAETSIDELIRAYLETDTSKECDRSDDAPSDKRFDTINKVLIHARACTAVKLIRDIQTLGIKIALVQSDPDMDSVASQMLGQDDEVYCLGGSTPDESYLNANSVLRIAEITNSDALHPGIGFLSEDPEFAYRCETQGLNFIGPAYQTIAKMGDKAQALNAAIEAQVPVVPGSHGVLKDWSHAKAEAERVGFPLILKAVFGGGGKGIAVIHQESEFEEAFKRLSLEAKAAFGRGDLYLEKFISSMRHVEAQVLRDQQGHTLVLGLRDCSVQRNNQKLLEESDSGLLTPDLRQQVLDAAAALADSVSYIGAGTVEFIFDLSDQSLYFMEMNTRLQVEHPVTEAVSGINIVAQQMRIASGESIASLSPQRNGYAIEARITAEQVELIQQSIQTSPSPGLITKLNLPDHTNISVISSIAEGSRVESFYDSLIIQIIAHGKDRIDAINSLHDYLDSIVIEGIDTNISLLKTVLKEELFRKDQHSTAYLQDLAMRLPESALAGNKKPIDGALLKQTIRVPGSEALKVFAPSNGIFYSAASPEDQPYISVGDQIRIDDTLCLFEAMKIYRPFKLAELNQESEELYPSDNEFQIKHINPTDGQCINAGDLLFVLEPVNDHES